MGVNILSYHAWANQKLARKGRVWRDVSAGAEPPPPPPPPPTSPIDSRFPGDPNPRQSGLVVWGIDEFDQDPQAQHVSEVSKPETVAGVPVGGMRSFYAGGYSALNPPSGAAISRITEMHSKGRIPWVSANPPNVSGSWVQQADGRNNAVWDAFIHWAETSATGPVWFSTAHEPETETISKGGVCGTEGDWYNLQKAFRARMTAYASTRGGASYVWKNLGFGSVLTAYAYTRGSNAGGIDRYMPTPSDSTFDFMGADYYVGGAGGTIGSPTWGANIIAAVNWCRTYGYPLGLAEWGVNRRDPDAATKMQELWDRIFDGTNDIFAAFYYNSSVGSTSETEKRWMLDDVSNGGLLSKYVSLLQHAKSAHFWDLPNPSTGVNYPRPPGV